jgi:ATP-dependent DNA ligase
VVDADLEGIVAKRLADAYHPKRARWHEVRSLLRACATATCSVVRLSQKSLMVAA